MKILNALHQRIYATIRGYCSSSFTKNFISHNKPLFIKEKSVNDGVVLVEFNLTRPAHISYAYVAHCLAKKYKSKIIAYTPRASTGIKQKLAFWSKKLVKADHFGVYHSFGTSNFLNLSSTLNEKIEAKRTFDTIINQLNSVSDIENISINNVWIGDLIYDTYLRTYHLPTIDITSRSFKQHLLESIELFTIWKNYLEEKNVKAIILSHCVYNLAIPLRLAIPKGIPVYQANLTHIYSIDESNLFAYNDFRNFPIHFSQLSEKEKKLGVAEAKKRIERRFSGEVGVDMAYSKESAYAHFQHERLLTPSSRKKILIAAHCFYDSPHGYGKNLFPDFYEWLDFLGKISEETNYDWYVKTHPDYLEGTKKIIEEFIQLYPKLTLLPANASHHQIISEGIDVALSVYGTIGFEYAALGIPVINASQNNPHIAYDFNLHPKTVDEYRHLLINLEDLEFNIKKEQVYEYYFMKFIFNTQNLFFNDHQKTIKKMGGYRNQFTSNIYDMWQKEFTQQKHQHIVNSINNFIESGDFRMNHSHFGKTFNIDNIGSTS